MLPGAEEQGIGFGHSFQWDIELLKGYSYSLLPNRRKSPELGRFWGSNTPGIIDALRSQRPDAVILTGWQSRSLIQALRATIRLDIPRIVRGESNAMRARPLYTRLLHRMLLSRYNAFLAIGKSNRQFYESNGVPQAHIFDCPYFVDNRRFEEQHRAAFPRRVQLRHEWGIPEDAVCFLFAGKLQAKKRIMDLMAALNPARQIGRLYLLVVGTGDEMEAAKSAVQAHQLPVTFAGFLNQTQITDAYAAADCLVLPSDYGETWGLVVNEGMVCGLPAIVSDRVGCGPDLIEDDVTGWTFPFGNVNALSSLLVRAASDPVRLWEMGQNARKKIENYSVSKAVEGTMQAVRCVMSQRAGRHSETEASGS